MQARGTWLAQATTKALDRMGGKARIDVGRDKPYIEWLPLVRWWKCASYRTALSAPAVV